MVQRITAIDIKKLGPVFSLTRSPTALICASNHRYGLLAGCAFFEGATLGPLVQIVLATHPGLLVIAFLGTSTVFACFSAAALLSRRRRFFFFLFFFFVCFSAAALIGCYRFFFSFLLLSCSTVLKAPQVQVQSFPQAYACLVLLCLLHRLLPVPCALCIQAEIH